MKEHSDLKKSTLKMMSIVTMLEFLVDNIFVVFAEKVFQHIVGIRMGTHCAPLLADMFLYSYEAEFSLCSQPAGNSWNLGSISHIGTSMMFYKQPRVWELPRPDVSRWTWDQIHDREQHFCFLPGFTSVDWEGWSTSYFNLWQTWRFQFPYHKFSVPE